MGWVAIHGDGVGVGLITEVSGFFIIFLYLYQRTNDPDFIGWGFHSEAGSHILCRLERCSPQLVASQVLCTKGKRQGSCVDCRRGRVHEAKASS